MIKSIFFRLTLEGVGIVNFDSNSQKFLWNRQDKNSGRELVHTNNVSLGKAVYNTVDDEVVRTPKISADCLRHEMWAAEMSTMMPNVIHVEELLLNTIATPALISRGYLFARDNGTFKRKSALNMSPAHAHGETMAQLETHSTSAPKEDNLETDKSATSFFAKETRGKLNYVSEGSIDLVELAFISMSDIHGRLSFNPDLVGLFREKLSARIGSEIPEPAYYQKKNDIYSIPEYGILLSVEQVKFLVGDVLNRLASINIQRTTSGYARTAKLEVKLVKDPVTDLFSDEEGWFTIKESNKKTDLSFMQDLHSDTSYYTVDPSGSDSIAKYKERCLEVTVASKTRTNSEEKPKGKVVKIDKKLIKKIEKQYEEYLDDEDLKDLIKEEYNIDVELEQIKSVRS